MTKKLNLIRLAVILLFVIAFVTVGWLMPIAYATHVPQSEVMEVHSFTAEDTTTSADQHHVCFNRTVHRQSTGEVFTELYLVNGGDERVEIAAESNDRFFQGGQSVVITPYDLPDNLREGEYKYVLVVKMELAGDRVTRTFVYKSDSFRIENGLQASSNTGNVSC